MTMKFWRSFVLYILGPTARWCPMFPHFLKVSFQAIGTGWFRYPGQPLAMCWCPSPFPISPSISLCFSIHSSSPAIGFHSCFFFTTDVHVSAPILSTLHLLMVSFQVWDWLWYPMLWSQRMGCA